MTARLPHWLADAAALHIYDHAWPHDPQLLVGTTRGLTALRDAINTALAAADGYGHADAMSADGEGYTVLVARVAGEALDLLPPGYTHEIYRRDDYGPEWSALYQAAVKSAGRTKT